MNVTQESVVVLNQIKVKKQYITIQQTQKTVQHNMINQQVD